MDPITLGVGAAVFAIGFLSGRVGRARRRSSADDSRAAVMCSCGDTLGQHDRKTGRCHAVKERRANAWRSDNGLAIGWEWPQCTCQSYDGPPPLDSLFPPPPEPHTEQSADNPR